MKTTTPKTPAPSWVIVDASGQSLGRMSAQVAHRLRGKHRPTFAPHQLCGDHVVIINASKLAFPQKKLLQKMYHSHTGYIGHLKSLTLGQMMEKDPKRVVELAVKRMLPSNRLRPQMLKRLHIYADDQHEHEAQEPAPLTLQQ